MQTIVGMRRLEETLQRSAGNGDNWHMTWARDGKQYVVLGDGKGWPDAEGRTGPTFHTKLYGLDGDPPDLTFAHLHGYPDLIGEESPSQNRFYGAGILAIDDCIYHFLGAPNPPSDQPAPRYVGSKLVFSPDQGRSWKNQDGSPLCWEGWADRNRGNMIFFDEPDEAFSLVTLLQMGKDYEHNKDGYIYGYAPFGNGEGAANQLAMLRVAKDRIRNRSEYEFFVARNHDGSAKWSDHIDDRGVVYSFLKCHWPWTCWHPSVVYNAPFDVFMMANWAMGCGTDGPSVDAPSYLGFWLAEKPWGPWRQVHEEKEWTPGRDRQARAYQPQISPRWIANDGKSFWLVFSDFQNVDGEHPHYGFNYQQVEILTA